MQMALEPRPEDEKEAVLGKRGKGPRGAETPCKGPEAGGLAGSRATGRSVWLGQSEQRAADTQPEVPGLCGSLGCGRGARKGARMRGALTRLPLVPPSRSAAKCCMSVCLADSPGRGISAPRSRHGSWGSESRNDLLESLWGRTGTAQSHCLVSKPGPVHRPTGSRAGGNSSAPLGWLVPSPFRLLSHPLPPPTGPCRVGD